MTGPGLFITLEGIDGAGKSTHLAALRAWLAQGGRPVIVTREPGGTPLAEIVRDVVLNRPMDALTETLLVFAARRDHLQAVIEPALKRGAHVLCDRFTDASFAYQGSGRGVDVDRLTTLEAWVQQGRQPDVTLWFDAPPATAARRRSAVRSPDRFEAQDTAFFERVRAGYLLRAAADPARFACLDAALPPDAVWRQVEAAMQRYVGRRG